MSESDTEWDTKAVATENFASPEGGASPDPPLDRTPLIVARGLSKSYGSVSAVRDLSFVVARGEIVGLLGPNGAGKSTSLRMLIGFQFPDEGSVELQGLDVFKAGDRARAALGYLPESLPLYPEMDVRDYLGFFARLKQVPSVRIAVDRAVERLDLGAVYRRPCGNLSRGYRQRVGLAQALLADPAVLILDEPTSGLDPNQIQDFRNLIRGLGRDRAILLSTHILPEALEVCDRLLIMNKGSVVAEGRPGDLAGAGGAHWARVRVAGSLEAGVARRFAMTAEVEPQVYRLQRELRRDEVRDFLRVVVDEDWELLEWHTGAAGLETVFRRLTLGEDS